LETYFRAIKKKDLLKFESLALPNVFWMKHQQTLGSASPWNFDELHRPTAQNSVGWVSDDVKKDQIGSFENGSQKIKTQKQ
jgi:hypothetical protein